MAHIKEFKGVLYDHRLVTDIGRVTAPPYDMISPEQQQALHDIDENNVVRLILGRRFPQDTPDNNQYTRAASCLAEWLAKGILRRDERPAIYEYDQEYAIRGGNRLTRRGFIALARLEEPGGNIHPHEKTMSGPKEDRLKLMMACRANLSQVFAIYDDPDRVAESALANAERRPRFDFTDANGIRHGLASIHREKPIEKVKAVLSGKELFIADGHHRYETALNFRNLMNREMGQLMPESYNYIMMYFANMAAPGMTILPFHRLIAVPEQTSYSDILKRLEGLVRLTRLNRQSQETTVPIELVNLMAEADVSEHRFGMYLDGSFYLLSLPRTEGEKDPVAKLDVSILHHRLIAALFPGANNQEIEYQTSEAAILNRIKQNDRTAVFFLNPTRVDQVRDIAAKGLRMPPKSTNFHPKLASGLVFNVFSESL